MSASCCAVPQVDARYRRILWIALAVNATMFGVEIAGGSTAFFRAYYAVRISKLLVNISSNNLFGFFPRRT